MFAAIFLALVCVGLPALVLQSSRAVRAGATFPPRRRFYAGMIMVQGVLLATALAAGYERGLVLFPVPTPEPLEIVLAVGLLTVALGTLPLRARLMTADEVRILAAVLPRERCDVPLWVVLSLTAGVAEEVAYRGVLFGVMLAWTDSWWVAGGVGAAFFALAHAMQGWQAVAAVVVFALGFQWLVLVAGDLYAAMAVHALYDLIAGLAGGAALTRRAA